MKQHIQEFCRRGLMACSFGPLVLAILYLILQRSGAIDTLTVREVCLGIISLSALAFLAGGMNIVYQVERLPLPVAILLHGGVLYVAYLATYLINGWLEQGTGPLLVFSAIFVLGYLAVWAVIYVTTRRSTTRLNKILQKQQENRQ